MHEFPALPQRDGVWCPLVTVACVVAQGDRFLMVEEDIIGPQTRLRSPLVQTTLDDWLAGQRLPLSVLRSLLPGQPA